nr:sigma factor-like helix-turn-helix DNA-binding protein [Sulfurospirillum sp. 'SP']
MPELTHEQRLAILDKLLECEADIERILQKLEELQLYDCVLSLRDIAKVLKLSKTRIKQIEQKALNKLKEKLDKSA